MAVKQNDIRIGSRDNPFLALDNSDIISVGGNLACDLLCEEIPIDTLEIQCRYDRMHRVFAPSDYEGIQSSDGLSFRSRESAAGSVLDIPYATGLWYFNDDQYIGKFYVSDARRTGKNVYTITAVSAMGVLDRLPYYGKLFLNTPLMNVLYNIILTDGLRDVRTPFLSALYRSIVLAAGLNTVKVSGWIHSCTKREALHHVLFAQGLNLFKAENDAFLISRVSASTVGGIDPKNVYDSGSVDLTDRVKVIEVTEHSFVPNQNVEDVVLYDNTEATIDMEATVFFDAAPIMVDTITATGTIKIKQKNENCAVVSGVGTLTGKPYSHTSHTISRTNRNVIDGETITVSDATLVNSLNSNAVADRLFAYYTQRKQMQLPIVLNGERCGMKYGCVSPYGDDADAYIAAMTINSSAIAKADCRMISGYVPPEGDRGFSNVVQLTDSGTFTVPEAVLNADHPLIRVVLIGGGQGGSSGCPGEKGPDDLVDSEDDLAKPGVPGANGSAGKVYICDISDTSLEATYSYSCGAGGIGGQGNTSDTPESNMGEPGTDTTFGSYSSRNGAVLRAGYLDIMSGRIYAGPSKDFSNVIGGRGGGFVKPFRYVEPEPGSLVVDSGICDSLGKPIGTICKFDGSPGGETRIYDERPYYARAGDGAGSGGPCITQGIEGGETAFRRINYGVAVRLGGGAPGENGRPGICPMEINAYGYGMGGIGGMGGSAGGGAGQLYKKSDYHFLEWVDYRGGRGGKGGNGGNGAPGCILVYY